MELKTGHYLIGHFIDMDHFIGQVVVYYGSGHAINNAGFFILGQDPAPFILNGFRAFQAVVAHAAQNYA